MVSRDGVRFLRFYLASARSSKNPYIEIRRKAILASAVFNSDVREAFDVLRVVENTLCLVDRDFSLQVEKDRAGQSPIYSDSNGKKAYRFVSSQWFYNEAYQQTAASRFKLAHEMGHWILHPHNAHAYSRHPGTGRILSKHVAIEQEADEFALEFLMPLSVVERFSSPESLAKSANVPLGMAKRRFAQVRSLTKLEREQIRVLTDEIAKRVRFNNLLARAPRSEGAAAIRKKKRQEPDAQNMTLFDYADLAEGVATRSDRWFRLYGYRG